ncbi:hypothetical protein DFH08DRAFT_1053020 [Mycena albidolilacea]|uniref:Uncharacterized protein n=1 Tax=Mycena albidolilacea TaxID=1033008 RepID=A0AAD7ADB9_9AGAR|nr:hypothetical protein DFH08DRAFT_1053020 [Mycena albidolilacea]
MAWPSWGSNPRPELMPRLGPRRGPKARHRSCTRSLGDEPQSGLCGGGVGVGRAGLSLSWSLVGLRSYCSCILVSLSQLPVLRAFYISNSPRVGRRGSNRVPMEPQATGNVRPSWNLGLKKLGCILSSCHVSPLSPGPYIDRMAQLVSARPAALSRVRLRSPPKIFCRPPLNFNPKFGSKFESRAPAAFQERRRPLPAQIDRQPRSTSRLEPCRSLVPYPAAAYSLCATIRNCTPSLCCPQPASRPSLTVPPGYSLRDERIRIWDTSGSDFMSAVLDAGEFGTRSAAGQSSQGGSAATAGSQQGGLQFAHLTKQAEREREFAAQRERERVPRLRAVRGVHSAERVALGDARALISHPRRRSASTRLHPPWHTSGSSWSPIPSPSSSSSPIAIPSGSQSPSFFAFSGDHSVLANPFSPTALAAALSLLASHSPSSSFEENYYLPRQ